MSDSSRIFAAHCLCTLYCRFKRYTTSMTVLQYSTLLLLHPRILKTCLCAFIHVLLPHFPSSLPSPSLCPLLHLHPPPTPTHPNHNTMDYKPTPHYTHPTQSREALTQEVLATSAYLQSAAFLIGDQCAPQNKEFMKCKQDTNQPEKCKEQGAEVTSCVRKL